MSTAKLNTLQTQDGLNSIPVERLIKGACAAWVNFNGTGTVAIRAAYNVTSITDNGVGDWTVNFTVPLLDAGFAAQVTILGNFAIGAGVSSFGVNGVTHTVNSYRCRAYSYVGSTNTLTLQDSPEMSVTITR